MGNINDKYIDQVEHSLLLNSEPLDNYEIIEDRLFIKPKSYSRPDINDSDKELILKELSDDLRHYGLQVINLDDTLIRVTADSFELDIPKRLVIPYDDAIFASILKHHQDFYSNRGK